MATPSSRPLFFMLLVGAGVAAGIMIWGTRTHGGLNPGREECVAAYAGARTLRDTFQVDLRYTRYAARLGQGSRIQGPGRQCGDLRMRGELGTRLGEGAPVPRYTIDTDRVVRSQSLPVGH